LVRHYSVIRPSKNLLLTAAVAGLATTLAGCASGDGRFGLDVVSQAAAVPASRALVVPPPAGPPIVGVVERSYANAVVQNVALATRAATPGQSEIVVRALRGGPAGEGETATLDDGRMSADAIAREMDERLPGIDMRASLAYTQNKYGPFGFATGSPGNGDLCLYAWQRIERTNGWVFERDRGVVSIRLRLCEAGRTEAELLRTAYGLTFQGSARGFKPFDEPPGPSAYLGATGAPIYPIDMVAAVEDRPPVPERRLRSHRPPARAPEPVIETADDEPLPGYPTVPSPQPTRPTADERRGVP
jgi:hypothetical protein